MNTRQIMQGLMPTPEYERKHTFHTLRQFPELKKSIKEIKDMKLRSSECSIQEGNPLTHSKSFTRKAMTRSTRVLDELSKSSLDDISAMSEFRRLLVESRMANSSRSLSSITTSSTKTRHDALKIAEEKLTKYSLSFDSRSYFSHLEGFEGSRLNRKDFNVQLRRCLNINLQKDEFDAIFHMMDEDDSGSIDGVEFVRYFFMLGTRARGEIHVDMAKHQAKREAELKKKHIEELQRIKKWEREQIQHPFTESDINTAMKKLALAAFAWDMDDPLNTQRIGGFDARLSSYEFKQQIDKSFGIRLTGPEISALIHQFATRSGEHCIDGTLFLKKFLQLHQKAWVEYREKLKVNKKKKEYTLAMGQNVDFLPKLLGR